jgi:hypothetical protein
MIHIQNHGLLNPKPSEPSGYVTKDGMWAAVPFGKKFMIIHNGKQDQVCQSLSSAKTHINKQVKLSKPKVKPGTSSLEAFL